MKTEGQVRQQLKQVLFRHLKKRLRQALKKRPHTCKHNKVLPVENGVEIRACGHIKRRGLLCDARFGLELAKECPFWEPRRTKAEIRQKFQEFIESGDKGRIAEEYSDVVALWWVLDVEDVRDTLAEVLGDPEEGEAEK